MSDQPDNRMLTFLRRIDARLGQVADDVRDMKLRLTSVEEGLAGCNRRLDRLEARGERIERRLDIVTAD